MSVSTEYDSSMLISVRELSKIWNIHPTGVIHVGAHEGEEAKPYLKYNWSPRYWVEAIPEKIDYLRDNLNTQSDKIIQAVVWSEADVELDFSISNKSMSSSLFPFSEHAILYPNIYEVARTKVRTTTLDNLFKDQAVADFINLDIQGAELEALKGFSKGIRNLKWIYTEVSSREIYRGSPLVDEIDSYLMRQNFIRVQTRWWRRDGWGDALYLRSDVLKEEKSNHLFLKSIYQAKWCVNNLAMTLIRSIVKPVRFFLGSKV